MTHVKVERDHKIISKIEIKGHSDFANYGKDVCCAAISAITYFTINGVESFSKEKNIIDVNILRNKSLISIRVNKSNCQTTQKFLELLVNHFKELKRQFPKNLNIKEN